LRCFTWTTGHKQRQVLFAIIEIKPLISTEEVLVTPNSRNIAVE